MPRTRCRPEEVVTKLRGESPARPRQQAPEVRKRAGTHRVTY